MSPYQVLHIALRAEDKMMNKPPLVRHLPHKHKNLSSNPRPKKRLRLAVYTCVSSVGDAEARGFLAKQARLERDIVF